MESTNLVGILQATPLAAGMTPVGEVCREGAVNLSRYLLNFYGILNLRVDVIKRPSF